MCTLHSKQELWILLALSIGMSYPISCNMSWSHMGLSLLLSTFFLFSLIFLFLQKWPFSFQKKHIQTLNKQFSRFSSNFLLQNSQIPPPKNLLLRLLRGAMKSTKKLESQSHSVYIPHVPCQWMYLKLFLFSFPFWGFPLWRFWSFSLPFAGPTTNIASSFHAFLVFISENFHTCHTFYA